MQSEPENTSPELKIARELKSNLEITPSYDRTYVIVVAVNTDHSLNIINRISCKKGLPLGGYVYDAQSDSYHVECEDYLHLGFIPISFSGKVKGLDFWKIKVPLPEILIVKNLTAFQKKELKNFKKHFSPNIYNIQYIQMIDAN